MALRRSFISSTRCSSLSSRSSTTSESPDFSDAEPGAPADSAASAFGGVGLVAGGFFRRASWPLIMGTISMLRSSLLSNASTPEREDRRHANREIGFAEVASNLLGDVLIVFLQAGQTANCGGAGRNGLARCRPLFE